MKVRRLVAKDLDVLTTMVAEFEVFLGKIEGNDLIVGLAVQAAWVLGFILLSRYIFNRGVKRYSGFGG